MGCKVLFISLVPIEFDSISQDFNCIATYIRWVALLKDGYDDYVRTTLEIDDDVMQAAREMARLKNQGIGRMISDLARRGLAPEVSPVVEIEDAFRYGSTAPERLRDERDGA